MPNATTATQVTFLGEFISQGRRWNAYSDGTVLPVIAGGDGNGGDPPPAPPAPGAPSPAPGAEPTSGVPQPQVDRLVGTARGEGRKAILAALGLPEDATDQQITAAKEALAEVDRIRREQETEAQRREREAAARETAAQQREVAAAERERAATIRTALAAAGSLGQDQSDAALLLGGQVAADADEAAITAAVDELKKRRPELFTGTVTAPPPAHTDPGSPPPPNQPSTTPRVGEGAGADELKKRGYLQSA